MKAIDRIIPVPQKIKITDEKEFSVFACGYSVTYDLPATLLMQTAVGRLEKGLEEALGRKQSTGGYEFSLSVAPATEKIPNPDQAYSLKMDEKGASLCGYGEAGLFYAVTTLLQLLKGVKGKLSLPSFEILDYPDLEKRGHFIETRYGTDLMELDDWKQVVDSMVEKKQNHLTVSLYGCWNIQFDNRISEYVFAWFDGHPDLKAPVFKKYYSPKEGKWINEQVWTPMAEKDFFGQLRAYGAERGVDVIPMFNSLGHNTLIPRIYPEISAVAEDGTPSRLGFCVSNPKTYEVLFDLYDQILTRYGKEFPIKAFDIGLDEVAPGRSYIADDVGNWHSPICHCPECSKMSPREQLISHAIKLAKFLKSRGVETVYMYNDMICEHRLGRNNNEPVDVTHKFRKRLIQNDLLDTVCLDWWDYSSLPQLFHVDSLHPYVGIRRTAKPWNGYQHWHFLYHAGDNAYLMCKMAKRDEAEGIRTYSSWDNSFHRNNQILADYSWNFEGSGTPCEEKERYARHFFPQAEDDAVRAFELMEETLLYSDTEDPRNTQLNRLHLLTAFSFYTFPYYKHGAEYPRNYPGELVTAMRENPKKVAELKIMLELAQAARACWGKVLEKTEDAEQRRMAQRYAYDTGTYEMLIRDGLTLAEMDKLALTYAENKDPAIPEAIRALAFAQYERRKAHLALLEETKEHYIIPIQGRVASAPMQYFADVASYIEKTPLEELRLDVADLRHACSEEFFNLR